MSPADRLVVQQKPATGRGGFLCLLAGIGRRRVLRPIVLSEEPGKPHDHFGSVLHVGGGLPSSRRIVCTWQKPGAPARRR